jgi:hypothetical protein
MMNSAATMVVCLAVLAGCAGRATPVPVTGSAAGIAALAGEWRGSYETTGTRTGRGGSIFFRLAAERDTAFGEVVMVLRAVGAPAIMVHDIDPWRDTPPGSQVLDIRFVRSDGGTVTGVLEPYHDPECACTVITRFTGMLAGDAIDGTFTSVQQDTGITTGGRWQVTRHSRAP